MKKFFGFIFIILLLAPTVGAALQGSKAAVKAPTKGGFKFPDKRVYQSPKLNLSPIDQLATTRYLTDEEVEEIYKQLGESAEILKKAVEDFKVASPNQYMDMISRKTSGGEIEYYLARIIPNEDLEHIITPGSKEYYAIIRVNLAIIKAKKHMFNIQTIVKQFSTTDAGWQQAWNVSVLGWIKSKLDDYESDVKWLNNFLDDAYDNWRHLNQYPFPANSEGVFVPDDWKKDADQFEKAVTDDFLQAWKR